MLLEKIAILHDLNLLSVSVRVISALILGGLLGIEREQKQHPAGFRTYVIVCLGATLASITNIYMYQNYGGGDVSRIPAQVISGMGFLGAGTIIVTQKSHVHGLTTAAGLWCCATIGIAIGSGFYSGAYIYGIIIYLSLKLLPLVDSHFTKFNRYHNFYAEINEYKFINDLIHYCHTNNIELHNLELPSKNPDEFNFCYFSLFVKKETDKNKIVNDLKNMNTVTFLEELK